MVGSHIDRDLFDQLAETIDRDKLLELFEYLRERSNELLVLLADPDTTARARVDHAHELAGMFANFSLAPASDLARQIEAEAEGGRDIAASLAALRGELAAALPAFEQAVSELAS